MDRDDAETRARVWAALGNQPGVGAWFAVWFLARNPGTERQPAFKAAAPLRRDSDQVCVGH